MNPLEVRGLKKTFATGFMMKKHVVLEDVSFAIVPNSITGFLGANGAGKTTTLKCILSLVFPDEGEVSFFGESEFNNKVKSKIGFLPERPYFYQYLTGKEFLRFYGEISTKLSRRALDDRIVSLLKRVDLEFAKDRQLRDFSKGMLQKIGLAQALIHEPELLILDEPMAGLDPDGRFYLSELIKETAKEGRAVFFSSHLLHDTEKLCQNLVVLKDKRVYFQGLISSILKNINSGYEIMYLKLGKRETANVQNAYELASTIQKLRNEGCSIKKISQNQISLEEYFVKDVLSK